MSSKKLIVALGFIAGLALVIPVLFLMLNVDKVEEAVDEEEFVVDFESLPEAGHYKYSNERFGFLVEYPEYLPVFEGECSDNVICSIYFGEQPTARDDVYNFQNGISIQTHNKAMVKLNSSSAFQECDSVEPIAHESLSVVTRQCTHMDDVLMTYFSIDLPSGGRIDIMQDTRSETKEAFQELVNSFELID